MDVKTGVLALLNLPAVRRIDFSIGNAIVTPHRLAKVRAAIVSGKITIHHRPELKATEAFYARGPNELRFGFNQFPNNNGLREALILHECVHASFDIEKLHMTVQRSEAAAYITQALYVYYLVNPTGWPGEQSPFNIPATEAAWEIAKRYGSKCFFLKDEDCPDLFAAIKAMDLYRKRWGEVIAYDGV